jgi:hypothetical protein
VNNLEQQHTTHKVRFDEREWNLLLRGAKFLGRKQLKNLRFIAFVKLKA